MTRVGLNKPISCGDEDDKDIELLYQRMTCERYFGRIFAMEFNECGIFSLLNVCLLCKNTST